MEEKTLYSVSEAAKVLGTSRTKVYDLIHAGLIPVLKLGSFKIRRKALDEFLEKCEGMDISDPYNPKKITMEENT